MKVYIDCVRRYETKILGNAHNAPASMPTEELKALAKLSEKVHKVAAEISNKHSLLFGVDARVRYSHDLINLLSQLMYDMSIGREINAFENYLELLHSVLGVSIAFDWPVEEGFIEIHAAKMHSVNADLKPILDRARQFRARGERYAPKLLQEAETRATVRPGGYEQLSAEQRELIDTAVNSMLLSEEADSYVTEKLQDVVEMYQRESADG